MQVSAPPQIARLRMKRLAVKRLVRSLRVPKATPTRLTLPPVIAIAQHVLPTTRKIVATCRPLAQRLTCRPTLARPERSTGAPPPIALARRALSTTDTRAAQGSALAGSALLTRMWPKTPTRACIAQGWFAVRWTWTLAAILVTTAATTRAFRARGAKGSACFVRAKSAPVRTSARAARSAAATTIAQRVSSTRRTTPPSFAPTPPAAAGTRASAATHALRARAMPAALAWPTAGRSSRALGRRATAQMRRPVAWHTVRVTLAP
mmetsp:Transcript_131301/g.340052  ORF Transcript_131301/g.340052 Transcript_131301/m.340052 type:complete len:264 (-) Transcript_131301:462-1253(-)